MRVLACIGGWSWAYRRLGLYLLYFSAMLSLYLLHLLHFLDSRQAMGSHMPSWAFMSPSMWLACIT